MEFFGSIAESESNDQKEKGYINKNYKDVVITKISEGVSLHFKMAKTLKSSDCIIIPFYC